MYSRRKGKSGSTRPTKPKKPVWLSLSPKEIELLVVKLGKEGRSASQIGLILRDSYGIPDIRVVLGKRISEILAEKKISKEIPEDLLALIRRVITIHKHMELNRKDMTAKRGLLLTESKITRLVKYYKQTKRLAHDWKYDPKNIEIYAT